MNFSFKNTVALITGAGSNPETVNANTFPIKIADEEPVGVNQ
jgi:hypothetical protein